VILIIGGMGFIGLNTALRFLEAGQKVVISQHTSRRVPDVLKSEIGTRAFVAQMDVTNPYEVFDVVRRHQVESIVNLMAPPARRTSWRWRARSGSGAYPWAAPSPSTAASPTGPIARTRPCR
jgi:nucleoside-diphosphate-sugar epimerase